VGPRLPGRRLAALSRCAPRCPAETVHRCSPRSSAPWPSRSSRRGVWSGSGPLVLAVCSVRVRATEVSLRAFASPPNPVPKAGLVRLVRGASSPDPLRSVPSRVAPGSRVPTARPRVTASGVPVPPGSGPPFRPPKGMVRRSRLRSRPRRLSTTRPLTSAGFVCSLPGPPVPSVHRGVRPLRPTWLMTSCQLRGLCCCCQRAPLVRTSSLPVVHRRSMLKAATEPPEGSAVKQSPPAAAA